MHVVLTSAAVGCHFGPGWSIWIRIGKGFEIDTRHGLYVKLPFIGAGHRDQFSWTWDRWSTLRRLGEV